MFEFSINNKKVQLPTEWNELNFFQLRTVIDARYITPIINEQDFLLHCFFQFLVENGGFLISQEHERLTKIKERIPNVSEDVQVQLDELMSQVLVCTDSLNFLLRPSELTVNPYPRMQYLHSSKDEFEDLTYIEYALCETALSDYVKTKEVVHLDTAITHLYSEINPKTGKRKVHNEVSFLKANKIISEINLLKKIEIMLWMEGCFNLIVHNFPAVFSSGESQEESTYGHSGIIINLAGDKFGTVQHTQNQNVWTILTYIDMQIREAEKIKRL